MVGAYNQRRRNEMMAHGLQVRWRIEKLDAENALA
jgi:hypothetical protein